MSEDVRATKPLAERDFLLSLAQRLQQAQDLTEILTRSVETFTAILPLDQVFIALEDAVTGGLIILSEGGRDRAARPVHRSLEESLVSHALLGGEPIVLQPGEKFAGGAPSQGHRGVFPLIGRLGPLGVLIIDNQPHGLALDQDAVTLIKGLSSIVALAIDNERSAKYGPTSYRDLRLLVESAQAVSSSLDLGNALNAIAGHMMRALNVDWCRISDWNGERNELRILAEFRRAFYERGTSARKSIPVHSGSIRDRAISQDVPYQITELGGELAAEEGSMLSSASARSIIGLPLQYSNKQSGLIEIIHTDEPCLLTASTLNQCIRLVVDVASRLEAAGSTEIKPLLLETARALRNITEGTWVELFDYDSTTSTLRSRLSYGGGFWLESNTESQIVEHMKILEVVLREQRITQIRPGEHGLSKEEIEILFGTVGRSTALLLPLAFKSRTVGMVALYDLDLTRQFSTRELILARAMGNQAAIALENARLVRDLQHSLEQITAMQSHLVRAARLSGLGELSTVIAHQINNPLTTIIGDAEMLAQDIEPESPLAASAAAILRAGQRAHQVVERVLKASRYETTTRSLNVNDSIIDTLDLLSSQFRQSGITIHRSLAEHLPAITGVSGELEDIWMNLLLNARDAIQSAGERKGHIVIRSKLIQQEEDEWIEITVKDNGTGLDTNHESQIFSPLFTTKPAGEGSGLGLYISRQIVESYNGHISIQPNLDAGVTLRVWLPTKGAARKDAAWGIS
jgi:signal transduction histidine kinase